MLKVHHLNCGTMCPLGGKLWDGFSTGLKSELVCHCLAIETNDGLVLVDTGFGVEDIRHRYPRLSPLFVNVNNIQLREDQTALRQLESLGFSREDVRHIVITHLDFDHAGGITDFPNAKVHLLGAELAAAREAKSFIARNRYRHLQWDAEKNWRLYTPGGENWLGFECVRDLEGLPPEILLVPLIGHTWGHTGVAVQAENGWLFHAGDAYFYRGEMDPQRYDCTPGLSAYQTLMEVDRTSRLRNQGRLRRLVKEHGSDVRVFCAHDAIELEAFQREEVTDAHVHVRTEPDLVFPV